MKKALLITFLLMATNIVAMAQLTATEWYQKGLDEGDVAEKMRCFENAIQEDENYADAYYQKGLVLLKSLKAKDAISEFSIALQIQKKEVYFEARGTAYSETRQFDKALTDFNAVLSTNPQNRKVLLKKGNTSLEVANYTEALLAFNDVLRIEPLNTEALIGRANCYMKGGKMQEAINTLNPLLKREPTNQDALYSLGEWYELSNDTTTAISYFNKILLVNRKHLKATKAISRIRTSEMQVTTDNKGLPTLSSFKKKLGLFIGNNAYKSFNPLGNQPINDAKAMANKLASFGVDTQLAFDVNKKTFEDLITNLCNQAENADVVFLFYAGHGIERDGLNYFVPIDAGASIDVNAYIQLQTILARLQNKQVKYVVIIADACRSDARGMTPQNQEQSHKVAVSPSSPSNYYIGYGTTSGKTSGNGLQSNGFYTEALLNAIQRGKRLDDAFRDARNLVLKNTGNNQLPENTEGMSQPFIFN
jgi:tetratricopeptide (TPR) repeat protein